MPATPSAQIGTICPSCRAVVAPSNRFCPQCGAALVPPPSGGAPLAPPPPPVDIRQQVDADRGFLKRIQLLIPGFRGYRLGEDGREADSFLRLQIADRVHLSVTTLQNARAQMTQAKAFQALTDLAPVITDLSVLEGTIRHAEQGYSGISAPIRVRPEQLDQLYEYDYGFAQAADQLAVSVTGLSDAATSGNGTAVGAAVTSVRAQVRQLQTAFQARVQVVEKIRVGS